MQPSLAIELVLALATLVLVGLAISALIQLKKILININELVINTNRQLGPLLNDTHDTIKKMNTELHQLDEIVVNIRDIGDKVNATTRMVHEVISSPLLKIAGISAGAKGVVKKLVGR